MKRGNVEKKKKSVGIYIISRDAGFALVQSLALR